MSSEIGAVRMHAERKRERLLRERKKVVIERERERKRESEREKYEREINKISSIRIERAKCFKVLVTLRRER